MRIKGQINRKYCSGLILGLVISVAPFVHADQKPAETRDLNQQQVIVSTNQKPAEIAGVNETRAICKVLSAFKTVQVMEGRFEQEKKLPVFNRPLLSSGRFLSVKGHGVLWEVKKPVSSRMVLTPGVLKQYTSDGVQELRATGTAYDGMGVLLPAFLGGDLEKLSEYFIVSSHQDGDAWRVEFKPKSTKLAELITTVKITGTDDRVAKAIMVGAAGDTTHISFQDVQISKEPPGKEQLAWFM